MMIQLFPLLVDLGCNFDRDNKNTDLVSDTPSFRNHDHKTHDFEAPEFVISCLTVIKPGNLIVLRYSLSSLLIALTGKLFLLNRPFLSTQTTVPYPVVPHCFVEARSDNQPSTRTELDQRHSYLSPRGSTNLQVFTSRSLPPLIICCFRVAICD